MIEELVSVFHASVEGLRAASDFTSANLLRSGIRKDYFERVRYAEDLLLDFCRRDVRPEALTAALVGAYGPALGADTGLCLLVDLVRCYGGLSHPTTFNTPEGVALMMFMGEVLQVGQVRHFAQLERVGSVTLSLVDLVPTVEAISLEVGEPRQLLLSRALVSVSKYKDIAYRRLIYRLCKAIAEVDGVLSVLEREWLDEVARLDDDDPRNDIDVSDIR